jgi:predicted transcriptional regulator
MLDKRGAFEICADMLLVLDSKLECNKTFLAVNSKIDSRALSKYLDMLLRYELVYQTFNSGRLRVRISRKGREYLNQYMKMASLLE